MLWIIHSQLVFILPVVDLDVFAARTLEENDASVFAEAFNLCF